MPTYLCHGFRWHRPLVRMYIASHQVADAAPDWVVRPGSSAALAAEMRTIFHFLEEEVLFLEEYSLQDVDCRPHVYVCDVATRVDGAVAVDDVLGPYAGRKKRGKKDEGLPAMTGPDDPPDDGTPLSTPAMTQLVSATLRPGGVPGSGRGGWLEQLRAHLQPGAAIRWWVVVNEDEGRAWGGDDVEEEEEEEEEEDDDDHRQRRWQLRRALGDPDVDSETETESTPDTTPDATTEGQRHTPPPPPPPPPQDDPPRPGLRHRKSLDLRAASLRRLFSRKEGR